MIYEIAVDGEEHRVELIRHNAALKCRLDGRSVEVDVALTQPDVLSLLIAGKSYEIKRDSSASAVNLWLGSERYAVEVRDPRSLRGRQNKGAGDKGPQKLLALMPGKVVRLLVQEKAEVDAGQGILVVEAMKMQNEIKSPKRGVISKLVAVEGARVDAGDVLAIVD